MHPVGEQIDVFGSATGESVGHHGAATSEHETAVADACERGACEPFLQLVHDLSHPVVAGSAERGERREPGVPTVTALGREHEVRPELEKQVTV